MHMPLSTDFHFQHGLRFYSYCSFWETSPESGRSWRDKLLLFSHPNMSVVMSFFLVLALTLLFILNRMTVYAVIFNYMSACSCLWSPCLIQHTQSLFFQGQSGTVMEEAACLTWSRCWKRPGGKTGWALRPGKLGSCLIVANLSQTPERPGET